ncbi:TPA: DNA-binding protein [Klebsiella oxytoca]|uniref:DNA-binding protein n=1 Tax=Klebsiella oxytoca TaxID=571 RepID=A0AAN5LBL3_KLEOX|nr:DNA-binding protein [Klebsiella oxytoca]
MTQTTTTPLLALNGQAVPLRRLTVTLKMTIQDRDASGKSSSTATSEQGIKAKELQVSGLIPFDRPDDLKWLFRLAEAKSAGGAQQVYRISNADAAAVNMKQGIFSDAVGATPEQGLMAWKVDFTLKEKMSSAEKAAGRGPAGSKTADGTPDQHAQAGKAPGGGKKPEEEHGLWWEFCGYLNKWIGPAGNETNS